MSQGLGIVAGLLPKLIPLAQDGAKAAGQLMGALGKGLDSKGFGDLLTMMEQLSGPATNALIGLAGTIGGVLANALEQLAPYAVPMIKMLQELLKAAGPVLVNALKFIAQMLMDIGRAITPLLGPLGRLIGYMDEHPIFAQMASALLGVVVALRLFAGVMAIVDAVSAANEFVLIGIALVALAILIATHTHQIANAFDVMRHGIATAGHDIANTFDTVRHDIAEAGHDIATDFDNVRHSAATLAHDVAAHFDEIRHDVAQWAGDVRTDANQVISFFEGLPGRMLSALGNLGSLLWNAGASVIRGLVSGIESAVPGLHSALSWVSSLIPSWKGPIEADAQMLVPHGMVIMQGLMRGIASQLPALRSMLAGVTSSIPSSIGTVGAHGAIGSVGAASAIGAAGGSGHLDVTVHVVPSAPSMADPKWLQGMQPVIQEAVLRYSLNNPGNGLALSSGRR
jgi:phage-related protein